MPPFYITVTIHDKLLHNCMLDSGASHNIMPKSVMEELGLEITKQYQDLYSFDSRSVQCIGLIKDLVVTLTKLPMKSMVMDIVVANIPTKYGMLLSRSWAGKLRCTLQMDMTYTTVPIFDGEKKRLYRENKLKYVVRNSKKSKTFPMYSIEDTIDCFNLAVNVDFENEVSPFVASSQLQEYFNQVWKLFFDGAFSKDGVGESIVLIPPFEENITLSHKLKFDTTNNVVEYEALILGLEVAYKIGVNHISVFGDSELVV